MSKNTQQQTLFIIEGASVGRVAEIMTIIITLYAAWINTIYLGYAYIGLFFLVFKMISFLPDHMVNFSNASSWVLESSARIRDVWV